MRRKRVKKLFACSDNFIHQQQQLDDDILSDLKIPLALRILISVFIFMRSINI